MKEEITVSLRDRIISVPLAELLSCGKYAGSDSYECQVATRDKADIGGLLFNFDPIFCGSGVELHKSMDSSWGFHYGHLILLALQFALLVAVVQEERLMSAVSKCLRGRKVQ